MLKLLDQERTKLAGAEVPAAVSNEVRTRLAQAIVDSFRLLMFIAVGLALLSAIVAFLTIKKRPVT